MKRKFNYYYYIKLELLHDMEFLDGKLKLKHGNKFTDNEIKNFQKLVIYDMNIVEFGNEFKKITVRERKM